MNKLTLESLEKARDAMFKTIEQHDLVDWSERCKCWLPKTPRQVLQETTGIKLK